MNFGDFRMLHTNNNQVLIERRVTLDLIIMKRQLTFACIYYANKYNMSKV